MPTVEAPDYEVARRVVVDPGATALIVVDMQTDFVTPGGALVVEPARRTVAPIQRLLTLARRHGMAVFFTQDTHDPGDPEFPIWGQHVLRGSRGWQIVDELAPQTGERVIQKPRDDGFVGTSLDQELRVTNIKTVIGCVTAGYTSVPHTAGNAA